ncbi:MAG: menaquinone biosynthesis family protein [Acidobacteriota bacterium]
MSQPTLTIGQSADPDDAFMAWALADGAVTIAGARARITFSDIQTLNEWALEGRLEATALSAGAYPRVADRYRLLRCGASFGRDYGPLVVGRAPSEKPGPQAIAGMRVAVPGLLTTAYLLLRIEAGDNFEAVPTAFDRILEAVVAGSVDAGLIIHEGQLTYRQRGLHLLCAPARSWHRQTGLPVPLGLVGVRRDLGDELSGRVAAAFRASIEAALEQPGPALDFAAEHARGLDEETLRTFVRQYVDEITRDMGEEGLAALTKLYEAAHDAGLLAEIPPLDLLG